MLERGYLNLKKLSKLKKRNFFILLLCVILTSLIIWLFNSPQPHLKSIVSKTQLQIKNINSKLDSDSRRHLDSADSTYLELLGFIKNPRLFVYNNTPSTSNDLINLKQQQQQQQRDRDDEINENNSDQSLFNRADLANWQIDPTRPPLVSAFLRFGDKERALIESKIRYFLDDLFIIYDLDLSSSEQLKVKKLCNSSCILKTFKADKYPRHLVDQKMKAYKPIIIQEILNQYGGMIWIEPSNVFTSSRIEPYIRKSLQSGLVVWPLEQPVSKMTHPSMFKYLEVEASQFYFVHMLDTTRFVIYNTVDIHNRLMYNWVKCALKEDCVAPPGSKYNGCDLERRPQFLYSGCHRYEMSAFSILVAQMFDLNENAYTLNLTTAGDNSGLRLTDQVPTSFIQDYESLIGQNDKTTGGSRT